MADLSTPRYENDPRLSSPSTYDRQECIEAVSDLLRYLTQRLPYLDPKWILQPPSDGWPSITPRRFAPLGKTDEVVQLLAHLPYVYIPGPEKLYSPESSWPAIKRDTHLYDYRSDSFLAALEKAAEEGNPGHLSSGYGLQQPFIDVPSWVICLTTGLKNGDFLLLDTTDGTVTRFLCVDGYSDPDYAQDDPRTWRDECNSRTKPIREYFQGLKDEFEHLESIAYFRDGRPTVLYPGDWPEGAEFLKDLYIKYGWPNNFQRDACRQALLEWDGKVN